MSRVVLFRDFSYWNISRKRMMQNELNDQYFSKCYDDFQKQQQSLMNEIKQPMSPQREKELEKRITILQSMLMSILKWKRIKREE